MANKDFEGFLNALKKQYRFLANGGTSYRIETARLSLHVARNVFKLEPFLDYQTTHRLVHEILENDNQERIADVSKMLHLNAKEQLRKANEDPEFRAQVNQKMAQRKPLKLVKQ